MKSPSLQPAA